MKHLVEDLKTAQAFATSWNNLPRGSIYSVEQFCEWMSPLIASDVKGKEVLELGCGNGSLAFHLVSWQPLRFKGVDLGDSVLSARKNLQDLQTNVHIEQADLVQYQSDGYDLVYCIGVLHHLINPELGFQAILRNTKPGADFTFGFMLKKVMPLYDILWIL
jgi:2-polyprenyl-3-methyl-5-hydroxy-6-metoxy-1,4-benzoquinol methylase